MLKTEMFVLIQEGTSPPPPPPPLCGGDTGHSPKDGVSRSFAEGLCKWVKTHLQAVEFLSSFITLVIQSVYIFSK